MKRAVATCLLVALVAYLAAADKDVVKEVSDEVIYTPPKTPKSSFLAETFDKGFGSRWVKSAAKKEGTDEDIAKYNGEWEVKEAADGSVKGDKGLVLTSKARHAAVSAKLDKPFTFSGKPLVVQYEVKFQNGMDCGGAYVKLLSDSPSLDLKQVTDKTGYTIMFGPDTCGADKKLHFIMRHKNPKTGEFEEKHAKKPSGSLDFFSDKKTHLFRLTVRPNNEWEIHVDDTMLNTGSLLEDMTPPINPPAEIDDPNDFKPADWDDKEKIPDPEATKPIDWDEDAPEFIDDEDAVKPDGWLDDEESLIPDPSAEKPDDWDEDMDGEWEAPRIDNPKCSSAPGCGEWKRPSKRNPEYRGKWRPPMIDNPNYSGVWAPRKIANPDFFEDKQPYKMTPIGAVAFELWTMTDGLMFDNILITDDESEAQKWTESTWLITRDAEQAAANRNKPSLMDWVWEVTEDKPWIWAIAVVSALVPICLVVFCCMGSGNKPDAAAAKKKTDDVTADSEPDNEREEAEAPAEEDEDEEVEGAAGDAPAPSKAGRSALNEPSKSEDEDGEASLDEGNKSADQQSDSEVKTRSSPRKRKPRKAE